MGARALSLDLVGSLMEAFHLLDGLKTIREPEIKGVYLILNRIKDDLLVSHGFSNTVVIIFLFILNPGDSARPFGMAGRRYVTGYRSFAPLVVLGLGHAARGCVPPQRYRKGFTLEWAHFLSIFRSEVGIHLYE